MNKIYEMLKKNKITYKYCSLISNFIWKMKLKKRNKILKINGMKTLILIQNILKKEEISFFIAFGTLLGIVREGKLLPFDIDLDIALFEKKVDWEKLECLLKKYGFIKRHEFYLKNEILEQSYIYKGIVVDFFRVYPENGKLVFRCFTRYKNVKYSNEKEFSIKKYSVNIFKEIIEKNLSDKEKVFVPDNAEEHLEQIYGIDWRIPDKNWKEEKSLCLEIFYNNFAYIKKY